MIDVSEKKMTARSAIARAVLRADNAVIQRIRDGEVPKGDPIETAKVAGVQAAKNTSQIIPYCHPLPVDFVGIEIVLADGRIEFEATVKAVYKTGVEMEALSAASVAALTIYDMLKMFDHGMTFEVSLLTKTGGKSDFQAAGI